VLISHGFAAQLLGKHLFDTLLARAHWSESLDTYTFSSNQKMNYVFKGLQVTIQSSNVVGYMEGTDKKDEYVIPYRALRSPGYEKWQNMAWCGRRWFRHQRCTGNGCRLFARKSGR
jgi:hypothetical protein